MAAVFGIVYDAWVHTPQLPLFIAIMSGIFAAGIGPGLLLLGQMLGEGSYPRARFYAFASGENEA